MDIAGQFDEYNDSPSEELADTRAMFADWRIVGETLRDAVKTFGLESSLKSQKQ